MRVRRTALGGLLRTPSQPRASAAATTESALKALQIPLFNRPALAQTLAAQHDPIDQAE